MPGLLYAATIAVILSIGMLGMAAAAGTVQVVSPSSSDSVPAGPITLLLRISLDSGQVLQGILVHIDDVLVETRGIAVVTGNPAQALHRMQLDLAAGTRHVKFTAQTNTGDLPPASLQLRVIAPAEADSLLRPNLFVLAVGISSYQEPSLHLRFPAKDAIDFSGAMRRQGGGLYKSVKIRLLVDAAANKADLLDALDWLQHQATHRDVVVLFLAGHGIRDSATSRYYFLPADADLSAVNRTMLSQDDLRATLHSLPGKVLMFLDTCYAGQMMRHTERAPLDLERFVQELVQAESGVVVFSSSSGKQTSQESADWRNGAFTRAVVEGLSGKAALPGHEAITLSMLDLYISERVKQLTGGVQTPTLSRPQSVQDFPVALRNPQLAPHTIRVQTATTPKPVSAVAVPDAPPAGSAGMPSEVSANPTPKAEPPAPTSRVDIDTEPTTQPPQTPPLAPKKASPKASSKPSSAILGASPRSQAKPIKRK